ncbi:glycosyltransferase family 49 protein [Backusella circina FSU 941]|nr:glycosyltransferase family 49 protein [Backusella circina FSU 941]
MSFELKMSKMLSKTNTKSISGIVPYWKQSQTPITDSQDITLITVVYNETWSQFIDLVESWKGPVSAVLCTHPNQTLTTISSDYHQIPTLHRHVTLHLAPSTLPENASRNLARLYASTHHILDATTNIVFSLDLRIRLLENLMQYADMMARGDMLVVPTFKKADGAKVVETRQGVLDLIENGTVGLYDAHFELNQGPTDVRQWRDSEDLYYYPVERYAMQYEPIVIQSKTVQPWCSERFLNKRSVCLLSDYLAGNDFKVLTFGWAMYQHDNANPVSDLDNVLEKKIHIYFLIEQCIHHSRQLDALGLWRTSQAIHIKTLCPGVLAKWGKKLIKHY